MRANLFTLAPLVALLAACSFGASVRAQSLGGAAPDSLPGSLLEETPGLSLPRETTAEQGAVTPGLLPSNDSSEAARRGAADLGEESARPTTGSDPVALPRQPAVVAPKPSPPAAGQSPGPVTRAAPRGLPAQQSRSGLPAPPTGSADDAWRFKWHDDLWWYWTTDKTWRILQAGRWAPYQAGALYAREMGVTGGSTFAESMPTNASKSVSGAANYPGGTVSTYTLGPRQRAMGYRGVGPAYRSYGYGRYSPPTYYPGYGRTFGYQGGYYGGYGPGYGGGYGPGYSGGYYGSPGAALGGGAIGSSIGGWGGGGIGAGIGTGFGRGW